MCVCVRERVRACAFMLLRLDNNLSRTLRQHRGTGQRIYPCQENPARNSPEGAARTRRNKYKSRRKKKKHICQKIRSKLEIPFKGGCGETRMRIGKWEGASALACQQHDGVKVKIPREDDRLVNVLASSALREQMHVDEDTCENHT